jgi:hypothetical protein
MDDGYMCSFILWLPSFIHEFEVLVVPINLEVIREKITMFIVINTKGKLHASNQP